ncbi:MAG: hypothetical protein WAK48_04300 [Candidatus Acidiferrum sp.]
MIKVFRFLAICTFSVAFASIAWAQTYQQVDYPGAIATSLNGGPNPQGTSVGSYTDTSGVTHGFTLTAKGVFTSLDPPGSTFTVPNFINPQGVIVGEYLDSSNVSHGFILDGGKYTVVNAPGAVGTALTGINPSGEESGFTCTDPACGTFGAANTSQSFVISKKGDYTFFNPPGAISSTASTVNPSGAVVGAYTDSSGVGHGYLLNNGEYTTIDFPGATSTFAGGNNPAGDIAGEYNDTSGVGHSFLLSKGEFTSFDPPGTVGFSDASGINPGGIIVGIYFDSAGAEHGYIRTPKS